MKKRLTLDKRYAITVARLMSIIPTSVQSAYARVSRKLPRAELLFLLFAACAAVAAERTQVIAHVAITAQTLATDAIRHGLILEGLHYGIVMFSSLLLEAAALLIAPLAAAGVALIMGPTPTKRRLVRRIVVWSTVGGLAAVALIPCDRIVESLANAPHPASVPMVYAQSGGSSRD